MMRTFSFLFFVFFLTSCGKKDGNGADKTFVEITDAEIAAPIAPLEAQTFEIQAQLSGFSREQEDKISRAFDLIKKVIASDEFKFMVLTKKWNGKNQFVDNNGLTNSQIYKKLLEGAESLNRNKNNRMDLSLKTYFESANIIGYTMPNIETIYLNTKYLNQSNFNPNDIAMNLTHEWLHKLGFKHAVNRTPSRAHSVPYAIGYIMRKLAGKIDS
jgi:hypothetical protein